MENGRKDYGGFLRVDYKKIGKFVKIICKNDRIMVVAPYTLFYHFGVFVVPEKSVAKVTVYVREKRTISTAEVYYIFYF